MENWINQNTDKFVLIVISVAIVVGWILFEYRRNIIDKIEKNTGRFILIVVVVALIAPKILTVKTSIELFHFTDPVGDTIGGITGPILNFLGIILLYLTLKSQNKSINDQELSLRNQEIENNHRRDFELITHLSNYVKNDFEKLNVLSSSLKVSWKGLEATLMIAQSINSVGRLSGYTPMSVRAFFISYNFLLSNIENLLKKNIESTLSYEEKQIIFDQTEIIIEVLRNIYIELEKLYYLDEDNEIINDRFPYSRIEPIIQAVESRLAIRVSIYNPIILRPSITPLF